MMGIGGMGSLGSNARIGLTRSAEEETENAVRWTCESEGWSGAPPPVVFHLLTQQKL